MVEIYDKYTKGHSENVAELSSVIAENMGLSHKKVIDTYWAGLVHDIGKLLIPIDILNKNGKLNDSEYDLIKKHTVWGSKALESSESLHYIAKYILHHHERWDGTGYPNGLKGDEIPLISQIISVADSWDAMLSKRAYREPLSPLKALKEIENNKGKQFSPEVANAFINIYKKEKLDDLKSKIRKYTINFENNKQNDIFNSNLSFDNLFAKSKEGIVLLDKNFNIKKANYFFREMFDYSQSELEGQNIKTIVHKDKYVETNNFIEKLINNGELNTRTYRKKRDGSKIEVSIQAFPLIIEDEKVGYYIIYRDISELKNNEQKYKDIKGRYKALFNNEYTVMLIIDPESSEIVDANPAAVSFYGWSKDRITSMKISDINAMDKKEVKKELKNASSENKIYFEFKHKTAYKGIKNVEVYSQPIKYGDKKYLYSIIHDVTERKKLERQLNKQREKFKNLLEELSVNISFIINSSNPLLKYNYFQ